MIDLGQGRGRFGVTFATDEAGASAQSADIRPTWQGSTETEDWRLTAPTAYGIASTAAPLYDGEIERRA
jgi:hypothetical protein